VHIVSAASIGFNIKALIPLWGHRTVGDVKPVLCREYLGYRRETAREEGKNAADATIARELRVLAAAIRHDYKQGRL
jgi:glutathione S-transferase